MNSSYSDSKLSVSVLSVHKFALFDSVQVSSSSSCAVSLKSYLYIEMLRAVWWQGPLLSALL
jgi:hypothetical protein